MKDTGQMSRAERKRKFEPDPGPLNQNGDNEPIAESWSKTEQYKVKGRHRWTIDNFVRRASCTEVGDSLCSPVFYVPVEAYCGEVQDLAFQGSGKRSKSFHRIKTLGVMERPFQKRN